MEILSVLLFILFFWLWALWPQRARGSLMAPFLGRYYAHRGLHDGAIPENSLAAFRAAVEAGYGMELDVRLSRDGEVVVFHDATLKRMCGLDQRVDALTLKELRKLRLGDSLETVPTFREVLRAVNGKTPLIVEFKADGDWKTLCRKTVELLADYRGDWCAESFDPRVVRWFRLHAPGVLRGQLSEPCRSFKKLPQPLRFLMGTLLVNCWGRPHFIAYGDGERLNLSARLCRRLGGMWVVWTVRDPQRAKALETDRHAIIFEHFKPAPGYRAPEK